MPNLNTFLSELFGKGKAAGGPQVTDVHPRDRERVFFLMAMMFKCGQTTAEGLRTVSRSFQAEKKPELANALKSISVRVAQGKSLSKAIESEPKLFNDLHRAAIMAGEAADNMQQSFDILRDLEAKAIASSKQGMAELLTPLIMLLLSIFSLFNTGLNTLPVMAKLREQQGKPLGAIPEGIMNVTNAVSGVWPILAAIAGVGLVTLFSMYHSSTGRVQIHGFVLKIPIYGKFLAYRIYTNMLLYFPYMLQSGVQPKAMIPIMEALATNIILRRRIESFNHVITTGGSMSEAMEKAGFPEIAVTPVRVSENYAGNSNSGANNMMIEGMQHAHGILEEMLEDTHRRFIVAASALLWTAGGTTMLLDMVSIVLSQA